jgi:hypothetical protein
MGMKRLTTLALVAAGLGLSGCSSVGGEGFGSGYYTLVPVKPRAVADGSLVVTPPRPWNKQRARIFDDVRYAEDWTLNGPLLDGMMFVAGLPNNKYLVRQRRTDDRQVPKFRSDMTAPEITSMIETLFRVRGGAVDFRTTSLQPRSFMGYNGFQFDFEHLDSDELWRRGELYFILFDGARSHYYGAALPDFEAIVGSARLRRR